MRDVVITGVGAVTPLGVGARALHERWTAGTCAVRDGEAPCADFDVTDHMSTKQARRADRSTQLAIAAGEEALADAVTRDATLEDIDIDSLDLVELTQVIEESYGIDLEGSDFKNIATVGDVIDLVVAKVG